jgi:hypothetical protein
MRTVRSVSLRAALSRHCGILALTVSIAAMSACASGGNVGARAAAMGDMGLGAVVVQNNSWDRMTIYISRNGQLWRLGDVEALARGDFPMSDAGFFSEGHNTYLVARPLAGRSFQSETFLFPSGGVATWTIENQTGLSHVSVR